MTPLDDTRVILQDPRSFTVKICSPRTSAVLGTGIVVSRDGLIVTCAHVLRSGDVDPRQPASLVGVYFPGRQGRPPASGLARVVWYPEEHDDDVVCLRFHGQLPMSIDQVAALGTAHDSRGDRFVSYGYRRLQRYHAGIADGVILGEIDPPEDAQVLADPIQLRSSQINAGMSGAAVLDVVRNLVVGIVSETWFADDSGKDRDTAWAIDTRVLAFSQLPLYLRDEALPLQSAEPPVYNPALARRAVPAPGHRLGDAPTPLADWVGRREVLPLLDEAWDDGRTLVVGLVGFGGEGKSSLARHWVDSMIERFDNVAGVFWWSFGDRANAEEFLASAIEFMSGGQVTAAQLGRDAVNRAATAAGIMSKRRYLFVLDGLEVMQHQRGDDYGSVVNDELRDFLGYAATPGQHSLCVVTTRAPLLDLAPYVTYQHIGVVPLGVSEGHVLLRRLGVLGSDASLEQVVVDWGGHALTLTLLAAYLVKRYGGDVRRVAALPAPDPGLPRGEQVRQILREYDECLSSAERRLLTRCSVFRTPVGLDALRTVAEVVGGATAQGPTLNYLLAARMLRRDVKGRYGLHPLVRDFYLERGSRDVDAWRALNAAAQRHYLSVLAAADPGANLEDLAPAIEAAHHACLAGEYDTAADIVYDHLYQGDRALITSELNAYETALSVFVDFFPGQELHREPLVHDTESVSWILHEVATCLQMLGRLREAASMFRRASDAFKRRQEWHDAAISCQNMTELYLNLGALPACHRLVAETFELAARAGDKEDELVAETLCGALAHLEGRGEEAETAFGAALRIATEFTPIPALYSSSGVRYAELLFRTGRPADAVRVHRRNIEICRTAGWQADIVRCHGGLGDIALAAGDSTGAQVEYEEAVRIARGITRRDTLIAALLGRGSWGLRANRSAAALADVTQALRLAVIGGYRLAEVDARVLLAQLRGRAGDTEAAWSELTQAEEISIEIGYHWGRHDAAQARAAIDLPRQVS